MSKNRALFASMLASALGVAGFAFATPAVANPGNTTVTCTPNGDGTLTCTITDPDGIRSLNITNTVTGEKTGIGTLDCSSPTTSITAATVPAVRSKVSVTDCETPRDRTLFVIRADGSVHPR